MQIMILLVLFHSFVPDCANYYSKKALFNMLTMCSCTKSGLNRNYFFYIKKNMSCLHYTTKKNTAVSTN